MNIYFDRIKPLFDKSGKSDAELEREIGIPAKKISQWNIEYTKSYTKYIQQISSYFHVSADYLLGNTDDPRPVQHLIDEQKEKADSQMGTDLSPAKQKLIALIDELSDQQCEKLFGIIEEAKKLL